MPVLLYNNDCGEAVSDPYQLNPLTKYLKDAYDMARQPWPKRIINAWDFVITNLQTGSGVSVGRATASDFTVTVTDPRFEAITGRLIVLNELTVDYALAGITIVGNTMTFPNGDWPQGFKGNIDFTYNASQTNIPSDADINTSNYSVRLDFTNEGDFTFLLPSGANLQSMHLQSDEAETFTVGTSDGGTDVMASTSLAANTIGNYDINKILDFVYQKNVYFSGLTGNVKCVVYYK